MKKPKIVTSFNRYRDTDLENKARTILASLTSNGNFASPQPSLNELQTALDNYSAALSHTENGSKLETVAKNESRQKLEDVLYRLALYVETIAGSNELVLVSSGYSLVKAETPVGRLPKAENFTVKIPEKGMAQLRLDAIYGAESYQFEYRAAGTETWQVTVSSKSSLVLKDLPSGAQYEFRVAGIGAATERVYSNEIKSFIL
ncbi:fibronectin type III domain-containing protein [Pedobacter sp. KR3-3]|uniref:Fibronectin type III domain-containing protein n=1 Tax=Pedobacter albus TaxID=3113905 RepID=A0ABU7IBT6_9SPHI|nr:fibronectin type III domain-containing protein [Pedobacter sp. KR3-3]MEE1946928.1 fibronectin type III domain-containing protein [Pedobacter sp. KR3-3]